MTREEALKAAYYAYEAAYDDPYAYLDARLAAELARINKEYPL